MFIVKVFKFLFFSKLDESNQRSKDILDYLKTCEVKTIQLESGQPLAIVIKSDDIDESMINQLRESLKQGYNEQVGRIVLFGIGSNDDVDYVTLKEVLEKAPDVASQS